MNEVQPIRDPAKIEEIKEYLGAKSKRNRMMFVVGINTGYRIQDMLPLRKRDVIGEHITLIEMKTGKKKMLQINPVLKRELKRYTADMNDDDFLFKSRQGKNKPIKRDMAYKILREAAEHFGMKDIACHSMRKTFGYMMYQKTKDITLIRKLLNHSSDANAFRYIGMDQDMMDAAMNRFGL
ncbi:site-specific integrase [Paenibacillus sp. 11B]|uniref:site-specific integrase n=1 Tax=Bacillales TaxID=1385 RepID=UPI002655CD9E|nr:site-specific integrase [Paenibacillus sp. 11B]MDN8590943.1 site-specific integrase [Paenibacillus sp. 11B]